jgi:hypothetical protein
MAGELARVVSDHVPLNDGTYAWPKVCGACGLPWPCHTFQRQLQGQSGNRADRMRAHMTVWSLRMLSRPELAFIGREVSAHLLDWIDTAVAAQEAVDHARKVVQAKAQSAASRFAGRAWTAAGRFMPQGGVHQLGDQPRPDNRHGHAFADLGPMSTGINRSADRSDDVIVRRRVGRWRLGRGQSHL